MMGGVHDDGDGVLFDDEAVSGETWLEFASFWFAEHVVAQTKVPG